MSTNTPAKRSTTAVANFAYGQHADAGFENVGGDDLVLPFLGVLQSNSPQVTEDIGSGGIAGAKMGSLYNSVTDDLFDGKKGLLFTPACTEHCYVEWVPRDKGGGFVAVHAVDSAAVKQGLKDSQAAGMKFGKVFTSFDANGEPNGNQLTETFYVYGVIRADDKAEPQPVAIAFTSTKISPYKRWMTKVNMFTVPTENGRKARPPLFAHNVRITTTSQKNAQGTFANLVLAPAADGSIADSLLPTDSPAFEGALQVREMIRSGLARVSYETQEKTDGGEAPTGAVNDAGDPHF